MRSICFPKMFNTNNTRVWKADEHKEATMQNCITLLHTERGELFGDPYYGLTFKHYLFDQNNVVLKDAIIDIVYTQLVLFIPQLRINRDDIDIITDQEIGKIYCTFTAVDQIDFTTNTYQLLLFQDEIAE